MQFLIVGLGNIGEEYAYTRHNIGFMVVDALAGESAFSLTRHAHVAEISYRGKKLILIKPTTYMNLSGKAVAYHLQHYQIPIERLMVITDDISIPFGSLRIRPKGSDGGHNGLKHIQETLGHSNYNRLRVGIGNDFPTGKQVEFVLGKFSAAEQVSLPTVIQAAADACKTFAFAGLENAMNQFNKNFLIET